MGPSDSAKTGSVEYFATSRLGNICPEEDLGFSIVEAFGKDSIDFATGDILVVAQKVVSKAEGHWFARERCALIRRRR